MVAGLLGRIEELEARVARLEGLGTSGAATREAVGRRVLPPPVPPPQLAEAVPPATSAPAAARLDLAQLIGRKGSAKSTPALGAGSPVPILAYAPAVPQDGPLLQEAHLEQTIGLKWAGWVGSLVVIIGAALGVKYAFDAGWLGLMPPSLRLLFMAIGALGLLAAGEVVYRRVHITAAAGLFGAGVAALFLVAYTGHGFLEVYPQPVAFGLMALATLVGAGVAMRGRLVSIAVLAQVGGHLTPIILGGDAANLLPLLSYLLMLQVIALVLAWWGGTSRWWALRWVSLGATGLWVSAMLAGPAGGGTLPLAFTLAFAGLYLGELVLTSTHPRGALATARIHRGAGVLFSGALTAGLVLASLQSLSGAEALLRGGWIAGYAAVYALLGVAISRSPTARALGIALRLQAAALVVLAVPIALAGSAVVLTWAGMAVAFAAVGARLGLHVPRAASVVTWLAGIAYLVYAVDAPALSPDEEQVAVVVAGVAIPVYAVLGWLLALCGLALAWLLTSRLPGRAVGGPSTGAEGALPLRVGPEDLLKTGRIVAAMAGLVWIATAWLALPPAWATLAIVTWAWLLVALDLLLPRLWTIVQALAVLLLAAGKWALLDLLSQRLGEGWSGSQLAYTPVLNPVVGLGSLISGSLIAAYFLRRRRVEALADRTGEHAGSRAMALSLAGGMLVLVGFGLTMEIDRVIVAASEIGRWPLAMPAGQVRQLSFTMLWCVAAAAFAGLAIRLERDPGQLRQRLAPLGIVPLALAAKWIVVDTLAPRLLDDGGAGVVLANFETVAALLVLGVLLLYGLPLRVVADEGARRSPMAPWLGIAGLVVTLLLGMYEIWRGLDALNVSPLARDMATSVWWSLFAIGTVALGFRTRTAGLRYFGLALFGLTLLKVFAWDLKTISRGWRVLSFIALGLLLLGTSVLYGKYSPKLLQRD